MTEFVNHPNHYGGDTPYEVIKVLEAWNPLMAYHFCVGNTIKYQARAGKKPHVDQTMDMEKAAWYAEKAKEILKRITAPEAAFHKYDMNGVLIVARIGGDLDTWCQKQQFPRKP